MKITSTDIEQLLSYVFEQNEACAGFYMRFCRYFGIEETIFSQILKEYSQIISAISPGSNPKTILSAETILRLIRVATYDSHKKQGSTDTQINSGSGPDNKMVGLHILLKAK